MTKHIVIWGFALLLSLLVSCATTGGGVDYAVEAAAGADVFSDKNWNAPRRNNMYDRWEFGNDGTFHFWHVHFGEPLDRGICRYEAKDGVITITKEGDEPRHFAYAFSGNTVTLTPDEQEAAAARPGMGTLPRSPVTFTHAR
jgi:hypothetical protein